MRRPRLFPIGLALFAAILAGAMVTGLAATHAEARTRRIRYATPYDNQCITYSVRQSELARIPLGLKILDSPDGKRSSAIGFDREFYTINQLTGELIEGELPGGEYQLTWTPGDAVATAFYDSGEVVLIDLIKGTTREVLPEDSPRAKIAILGSSDRPEGYFFEGVGAGKSSLFVNVISGAETTFPAGAYPPPFVRNPTRYARISANGQVKLSALVNSDATAKELVVMQAQSAQNKSGVRFSVPAGYTDLALDRQGAHAIFQYADRLEIKDLAQPAAPTQKLPFHAKTFSLVADNGDGVDTLSWFDDDPEAKTSTLQIRQLASGEQKSIAVPYTVFNTAPKILPSRDGRRAVITTHDPSAPTLSIDLKTGQSIRIPYLIPMTTVLQDSKQVLRFDNDGLSSIDLSTGQKQSIDVRGYVPLGATPYRIVDDQLIYRHMSRFHIRDIKTGDDDILPISDGYADYASPYYENGSIYVHGANGNWRIDRQKVCGITELRVEAPVESGNCPNCEAKRAQTLVASDTSVDAVIESVLCKTKFSHETLAAWEKIAPTPNSDGAAPRTTLTYDQARALVVRFQKPGGFDPARHWSSLKAIALSSLPARAPDLFAAALQNILVTSPGLYARLVKSAPEILKIKPQAEAPARCQTEEERTEMRKQLITFLDTLYPLMPEGTRLADWDFLKPLTPLIRELPEDDKEIYADVLADKISVAATADSRFKAGFQSKYYKFAYQAIAPLVGLEPLAVTDLAWMRTTTSLTPIILGTENIDSDPSTRNEYGFSSRKLAPIPIPSEAPPFTPLSSGKITWMQGENQFTGEYELKTGPPLGDIVDTSSSPRYDELWKRKNFTGVIMAGSTLDKASGPISGVPFSEKLLDTYVEYYLDQGFEFEDSVEVDVEAFLKKMIVSGEAQYLIKEAHSDGDDRHLFRMSRRAEAYRGTLKKEDGTQETVYVVYPIASPQGNVLLSNVSFGEWLREREAAHGGQFLYLNTSCWSTSKARWEIEAARSKNFVNLAATQKVFTFENRPDNAEYILLDGLRKKKDYPTLRNDLKQNADYRVGKYNTFVFPDEAGFKTEVLDYIRVPLDPRISITDKNGHPYNLDQKSLKQP